VAGQDQLADRYLDALAREIASLETPQVVETLFIGGGTPTHVNARQLTRLMTTIRDWFHFTPSYEFTVESNPGTLDAEKVDVLADHGVNRLSLGAQSFHPHLLRVLERNHNPVDVPRAVAIARRRIPEISLDLIFGTPGQTLEQWEDDLQRVIDLGTNHLSTYGLTYEKGTPLWKQREAGAVVPLAEELERAMYGQAMDTLAAAGFEHYEISNFARPGHRCRHNLVYWANEAYFGFGLGAARYVRGRREVNTRDLLSYLRKIEASESPTQQAEVLDPEERARETAVLHLRRAEGITRTVFQHQTGWDLDHLIGPSLRRCVEQGLLVDDGCRVRLTLEGKFLADSVFLRVLAH
jgi:oxygen-independent coproporphyrinogen-3 oxidase